jgi:hypothetical protein
LSICLTSFREYWGQRLVNCLRALHNALYNKENENEEDDLLENEDSEGSLKNNFLSHQQSDSLEAFHNALNAKDEN